MSLTRTSRLAIALAVVSAACGGTTSDPVATSTTTEVAGPEATTITVVTHDSFNISDDVLAAFENRTGIEVEFLPGGDAGTVVNQAILTAGAPQGDVLFGVDNTFLSRALEADLFVPYEAAGLDAVDERYQLDDEHRVTPVDFGDVCLNYDREAVGDDEVPTDLAGLTAVADQLVVENPATSSPGLAFLLATIDEFGEDGYLDFWSELRDGGVTVSDGWEDAYYGQFSGGAGEGELPFVVSYASSPPAEVFFADPQPDTAPTGVIEAGCFRQVEFAGILRGTEDEAAAGEVIDWMLSVEFQQDIPLNMFVFPVRDDVELPQVFVEHAVVTEDPVEMDPARIGEKRDAWIDAWTDTVLR